MRFFNKKKIFLNTPITDMIKKILNKKAFLSYVLTKTSIYTKVKFYLGIIQRTLENGSQILILVPYIHYVDRIKSLLKTYFHVAIDVIDRKLNDKKYIERWFNTKNGEKKIIIGTNTSIFLPFLKLGLVIVIEEHSRKYHYLSQFRCNIRDIGVLRAFKENIPIILDSDTPSFKTLHNILFKKYCLINIHHRFSSANVAYNIIDLKNEKIQAGLSLSLINEMHQYIMKKKCILLIFNKFYLIFLGLICKNCGWVATCNICKDYYEVNKHYHFLFCKHCLIKINKPVLCECCGVSSLTIFDFSQKKIKNKIKDIFPNVPMLFLLNTTNKNSTKICKNFLQIYSSRACIIITIDNMVQNYFFPNIDLIGLICTDVTFFSWDFRAIEYFSQFYIGLKKLTKNTITSIKILIQTSFPHHPNLLNLCNNGYFPLAKKLLHHRKSFLLPPWSYQIIVYAYSTSAENTCNFLYLLYAIINKKSTQDNVSIWVMGPYPCWMIQYKKKFLYHLLIQCSLHEYLHLLLQKSLIIMNKFTISKKVKWFLDVNSN